MNTALAQQEDFLVLQFQTYTTMAKKKSAKIVPMQSPENYIRQNARNLPIHECWVSKAWKENQMAQIIVARKHTNGNLTLGLYLADLNCLGVKDAFYQFNISEIQYQEIIQRQNRSEVLIKADYVLVHNIIFEAIEFASLYEFRPCKDFTTVAKYILEDDEDESIELMDIQCGKDGKPFYIQGPFEDEIRAKQILAQLERVAGKGNYEYIYGLDTEEDEGEDWDEDEDEDWDEDEYIDEPVERDEEVVKNSQTFEFLIQLKDVSEPEVWRKLTVPSYFTFRELHDIIQVAFGWRMSHLFQFSENGFRSQQSITEIDEDFDLGDATKLDAKAILLSDVFMKVNQKFIYIYDFGDNWEHEIVLERIIPEISAQPVLLDGKGTCPPEDCGGPWAFQDFKQILADKKHPEYEEYLSWLGLEGNEEWNADAFDLEEAQSIIEDIFS
jgi:hypothetical protein